MIFTLSKRILTNLTPGLFATFVPFSLPHFYRFDSCRPFLTAHLHFSYLFISRVWFIFVYICLHYFSLPRVSFCFICLWFLCQGTLNLWLRQKKSCGNTFSKLFFHFFFFARTTSNSQEQQNWNKIADSRLAVNSQRFSQIFFGEHFPLSESSIHASLLSFRSSPRSMPQVKLNSCSNLVYLK